jgi:molecular chaperone HtpG
MATRNGKGQPMPVQAETREFEVEARQLLQLVIHSVYSNPDIFLRELISNAADALQRLRIEALLDPDLRAATADPQILVEIDRDQRTVTVRDNGIGMSRAEVISLIGTIARSGATDLAQRIQQTTDRRGGPGLIGQFGLGFYASFIVADQVQLLTRRAGETTGTRWVSNGRDTYTVEPIDGVAQGTSVTLYLRPADSDRHLPDYTAGWRLRDIIKRYSDFIEWPIKMATERPGDDLVNYETVNSQKALWSRPKAEVAEDEYTDLYRQLTRDWAPPLETIQVKAEGTFEYEALLFIPSHAPLDVFLPDGGYGLTLYARRVFVMDRCEALLPSYLRFLAGVVDAHDLPLNLSREMLQQDRQIQLIRRRLTKKALAILNTIMARDPVRYRELWRELGARLKEGLLEDDENQHTIIELALFQSTHDPAQPTTLREYVDRMPDSQQEIYYLTGDSTTRLANSPQTEALRAKGHEVLLLTDPVDVLWVEALPEYDGRRLQSAAKGDLDLQPQSGDAQADPQRQRDEEDFAPLLNWIKTTLDDDVKDVRLSSRLTTSPACLIGDTDDITPALEKAYRAAGTGLPRIKRALEINPTHRLIRGLRDLHEQDHDGTDLAHILYGMALLSDGGDLPDPTRFTTLITERLVRTLTPPPGEPKATTEVVSARKRDSSRATRT